MADDDEDVELEEERFGEAAKVVVRLEFNRGVETAPQAEEVQDEARRLVALVKQLMESGLRPELPEDWSMRVESSGVALE